MSVSQQEINERLLSAIVCIQDTLHSMKNMLSHQGEREVPEIISNVEKLDELVKSLSESVKK